MAIPTLLKKYFPLYLKGMAMGAADVVPGVSGGTIAFITGIYEKLLDSIKSFDLQALQFAAKFNIRALWGHINGTFLVALFATFGGIFFYIEYFSKYSFEETLQMISDGNLYGKVLSIAAIPNLFVFFIFLKKNQDNKAKGVVLATILIAFTTLILKFF